MKVTYVVPVYGKPGLLAACLSSLRKVMEKEPVIVVNDGGPDSGDMALISRLYGAEYLDRADNEGFGAACNAGIRAARTDYVCLVNSDIEFTASLSSIIEERFQFDPAIAVLGGLLFYPDGRIQHGGGHYYHHGVSHYGRGKWPHQAKLCSIQAYRWYVTGALMAIDRDFWEKEGPFDELLFNDSEDHDFCLKAWKKGRRVFYDPAFTAVHAEGLTRGATQEEKVKKGTSVRSAWSEREVLKRVYESPIDEIYGKINDLNAALHPDLPTAFMRSGALGDVVRCLSVFRRLEGRENMVVVTQNPQVFKDEACKAVTPHVEEYAWGRCINLDMAYERRRGMSIEEAYCRAARIPFEGTQPVLFPGAKELDWMLVRQRAPEMDWDQPFVVMHAGCKWPSKTFPPEFWDHLLRGFNAGNIPVVMVGSEGDFRAKGGRIVDLVGQTHFDMLRALLEKAALFIGPDSGPLNLADGACPAIGLFTCALPEKIVSSAVTSFVAEVPCVGCLHRQPASQYYDCDFGADDPKRFLCTRKIDPDKVLEKAARILGLEAGTK